MAITVGSPGLSPESGSVGTTITITGAGFMTTPAVRVWFQILFGTTSYVAASFSIIDDNTIHATVPSPGGSGHYLTTWPIGVSSTTINPGSPDGETAIFHPSDSGNAPTVSSFVPTSGMVGDIVTVTGIGFTGATGVSIGGASVDFTVISDTQINTFVPALATTGTVGVANAEGSGFSGSNFTVIPLTTSIIGVPDSGTLLMVGNISTSDLSVEMLIQVPSKSTGDLSTEQIIMLPPGPPPPPSGAVQGAFRFGGAVLGQYRFGGAVLGQNR